MEKDNEDKQEAADASYEDELSKRTVTIPLKEYDALKNEHRFIKDKDLIEKIDSSILRL